MEDEIRARGPATCGKHPHRLPHRRPDGPGRPRHRQPAERPQSSSCSRPRSDDPDAEVDQDAPRPHQQPAPPRPSRTTSWPRSATRRTSRWPAWSASDEAELVLVDDLIARITVQTCRQSGLSVVYQELLDFDGDEIYFTEQPALVGRTFGDALLVVHRTAPVIGLVTDGVVSHQPADDTVIGAGDQVIVIAEDDSLITLGEPGRRPSRPSPRQRAPRRRPSARWCWAGTPGSQRCCASSTSTSRPAPSVHVVSTTDPRAADLRERHGNVHVSGDPTKRAVLDGLEVRELRPRHRAGRQGRARPAARRQPDARHAAPAAATCPTHAAST